MRGKQKRDNNELKNKPKDMIILINSTLLLCFNSPFQMRGSRALH